MYLNISQTSDSDYCTSRGPINRKYRQCRSTEV